MKVMQFNQDIMFEHPLSGEKYTLVANENTIVSESFVENFTSGALARLGLAKSVERLEKFCPEYKGENLDGKVLLVIRYGGIGDLLFITPSIRKLRRLYPKAKIYLLCSKHYFSMFSEVGLYDDVLENPITLKQLKEIVGYSISRNNSYSITFEGWIERSADSKTKNAYDLVADKFYFKDGLEDESKIPSLFFNPLIESEVRNKYSIDLNALNIGYQFSASSVIRTLRPEKSVEFLNSWDIPNTRFFILDAPYRKTYIDYYLSKISNPNVEIVNTVSKDTTIAHAIGLVANMKIVIGPDSSIMHIAGALGIPMVGIFSAFPTDLRLRYYENVLGIDVMSECPETDENYRSCFQHGTYCTMAKKYGRFYSPCMELIESKKLVEIIKNFLSELKIV